MRTCTFLVENRSRVLVTQRWTGVISVMVFLSVMVFIWGSEGKYWLYSEKWIEKVVAIICWRQTGNKQRFSWLTGHLCARETALPFGHKLAISCGYKCLSAGVYVHNFICAYTFHSQVTCITCNYKSNTVEPFWDLSLEFPERYHSMEKGLVPVNQTECMLTEMLAKFTETEALEGRIYACDQCNSESHAAAVSLHVCVLILEKFLLCEGIHEKRFLACPSWVCVSRPTATGKRVHSVLFSPSENEWHLHHLCLDLFCLFVW